MTAKTWIDTPAAAEALGVSVKTLGRWRDEEADGAPKAPCRQPGGPRGPISWSAGELDAWIEARSTWHRRRHLRLVAATTRDERPEPPRQESLFIRAMTKAKRR